MPEGFVVGQLRHPAGMRHPLDLHACPAFAAHIDVGAGRPDARADLAGASVEETDVIGALLYLSGILEVGMGNGLDEGHPQTVGAVNTHMTDIGYFAAGILLEAELDQPHFLVFQLDLPVDADDGGALKPGRNGTVEVLLSGDMDLAYNLEFGEERNFDGLGERLPVQRKRWRVVDIVGAGRFILDAVNDVLARAEFHQGSAVVLAEFAQRGPHVADQFGVVGILALVDPCRAPTEEFFAGVQLLVDLQTRHEPDTVIIGLGGLLPGYISDLLPGFVEVLSRIEGFVHGMSGNSEMRRQNYPFCSIPRAVVHYFWKQ